MTQPQQTVRSLFEGIKDGDQRTFAPAQGLTGGESSFYRVTSSGGTGALPFWENRLPLKERPTPQFDVWNYVPLAGVERLRFSVKKMRSELADLYHIAGRIYLVSSRIVAILRELDGGSFEYAPATVRALDGDAEDYLSVVPQRVLDAVDTAKTKITFERRETVPGSGRYVTFVRYDDGYALRPIPDGVHNLVEEFSTAWLWSDELVRAAVDAGAQWLRAVPTLTVPMPHEVLTRLRDI